MIAITTKSKNLLFPLGLTVLIIGWLACLNPYFIFFAWPVLICGLLLIWFSRKKIKTKILLTILPILLWYPGFLSLMYFGSKHMTPETFLIPETFRGNITLVYNEPCGQSVQLSDGRLIYKIPDNGVMIIKNEFQTGIIDHEYYLVDQTGKKLKKLDLLIQQNFNEDYTTEKNKHEPPRNKIGIFLTGTGSGSTFKNSNYVFHMMHVNSWDSLRVSDSREHENLVDSLLYICRTSKK